MNLKFNLKDSYEDVFEDEDFMILYCGTHPVTGENGKMVKFSSEAGSSSHDRMLRIAGELIDAGYDVSARRQHVTYKMETELYSIAREVDNGDTDSE